jgi:hypothetical protein
LINNSVPTSYRASTNGIAMAMGSLGKGLGPTCASLIYAWSLHNGLGYPLDHHLVFFLVSAMAVLCYVGALGLTDGEAVEPSRAQEMEGHHSGVELVGSSGGGHGDRCYSDDEGDDDEVVVVRYRLGGEPKTMV